MQSWPAAPLPKPKLLFPLLRSGTALAALTEAVGFETKRQEGCAIVFW